MQLLERIDMDFICVHAHPNNFDKKNQGPWIEEKRTFTPDTLELTFLRHDRLDHAASGPVDKVMLPHPLDISNASHREPLFLDLSWQPDHKRHLTSRLRMLQDYGRWLLRRTKAFDRV